MRYGAIGRLLAMAKDLPGVNLNEASAPGWQPQPVVEDCVKKAVERAVDAELHKDFGEVARAGIQEAVRNWVDANGIIKSFLDAGLCRAANNFKLYDGKGPGEIEESVTFEGDTIHEQYRQIRNILAIESNPVCKAVLQEWDRKEEYLGKRVEQNQKAKADVVSQLFNIVGFFSVFQGVLLTGFTQLHTDKGHTCGVVYLPIILCLVGFCATVWGLRSKFGVLKDLESELQLDQASLRAASKWTGELRRDGYKKFKIREPRTLAIDIPTPTESPHQTPPTGSPHVYFLVLIITVLFILSHIAILCNKLHIQWKS